MRNTILSAFVFIVFIHHVTTSNALSIDEFLECLQFHSNQSNTISNAIYTPTNPSFQTILQNYIRDSRFNTSSTPKPLAIVTPLDVTHVQATVRCAKMHDIHITIRSGGHDYEGLSYVSNSPFVIVDMFNLRSIDIDIESESAWVESGAILGELYYKIAQSSRNHAYPAGECLTLGVGGHISGGGYGSLQREYGLSIDNIIDAIIVDANGTILDRQSMGEDLFWAISGGGGASFCVIISWKIKLVRIPESMVVFNVTKSLEQGATNIVIQWQKIASTIDSRLFIRVQPRPIQQGDKKTILISFVGSYIGDINSLLLVMTKSFPLLDLKARDCFEIPWIRTLFFLNAYPIDTPLEVLLQRTPTPPHSYLKRKSDYVKTPISRSGLESLWKKMMKIQSNNNIFFMQWNPYGGKMSEIPSNATAFPHRSGNLFMMQYIMLWGDDGAKALSRNVEATREIYGAFTPYVSKNPRQAFLNYRDIDIGTNVDNNLVFAYDYYKENVKRLLQVKAKVDPSNFFRNEQSIPIFANV